MHVTKPIDINLLGQELTSAGVPHNGVHKIGTDEAADLFTTDEAGVFVDLPPEAEPVVAKHDGTKKQRTAEFESQEDVERLRLINERAQTDPAFAALVDLTLGKQGVIS